jgi:hypothetical protein
LKVNRQWERSAARQHQGHNTTDQNDEGGDQDSRAVRSRARRERSLPLDRSKTSTPPTVDHFSTWPGCASWRRGPPSTTTSFRRPSSAPMFHWPRWRWSLSPDDRPGVRLSHGHAQSEGGGTQWHPGIPGRHSPPSTKPTDRPNLFPPRPSGWPRRRRRC